jgi:hypothetical protein
LANRLADALVAQASVAAASLPEAAREPFVAGMTQAASGGLQVGAGQAQSLPSDLPPGLADQLTAAAHHLFASAFTDAMDPVILVAVGVILAAAVAVLFVRSKGIGPAPDAAPDSAGAPALDTA